MAYTINRAHAFDLDYDEAISYLVHDLRSPRAALRLINEVGRVSDLLADAPYINAPSDKLSLREKGLREHYVLKYVIVYRIDGEVVWFLRLFHQAQLYERFVTEWGGSE